MIKRFQKNKSGRDFAVGDIHGCFTKLQAKLEAIGFDRKKDRLFSVGDLVDRGPESDQSIYWLLQSWFHPVRGNHDDYVCRYELVEKENWLRNGGQWFYDMDEVCWEVYRKGFSNLPIAIEVETSGGLVGIVHADCPLPSWQRFTDILEGYFDHPGKTRRAMDAAMWLRERMENDDNSIVEGVRAVVVGHTPIPNGPIKLGNVLHIDTAGWHRSGKFTILDLETLEIVN